MRIRHAAHVVRFITAYRLVGALLLLSAGSRLQAQTLLTFEGLRDGEAVASYYSGGVGSLGSGPGPNLGVTITPAVTRLSSAAGGTGEFSGEPSPSTALFVPSITTVNLREGFQYGLSFFYANRWTTEVRVYEGPNLTGMLLSITYLAASTGSYDGATTEAVNLPFTSAAVTFPGTARSVGFVSRAGSGLYLDDVSLGGQNRYTIQDFGPATDTVRARREPHLNAVGQTFFQSRPAGSAETRVLFWDPRAKGTVDIGTFGGLETIGTDINSGGQIVGWSLLPDGNAGAFLWAPGQELLDLGSLGGPNSVASGLNDFSQVVGWASPATGPDTLHAFLWRAGQMLDLNNVAIEHRDVWQVLERAYSISNNGVIVGSGLALVDGRLTRRYFVLVPRLN